MRESVFTPLYPPLYSYIYLSPEIVTLSPFAEMRSSAIDLAVTFAVTTVSPCHRLDLKAGRSSAVQPLSSEALQRQWSSCQCWLPLAGA